MAVTIRVYQNTTQLASKTIPDGAVTEIQDLLGGATNAETAAAFLDWLAPIARKELRKMAMDEQDVTNLQGAATANATRAGVFDGNWS